MKSTSWLPLIALFACLGLTGCDGDKRPQSHGNAKTAGIGSALRSSSEAIDAESLDSLITVAKGVYVSGEFVRAAELFEQVLALARERDDRVLEADVLTELGLATWRLGDYSEARRRGEAALAIKLELGLSAELFRSYNALGLVAYYQSRYPDAENLYSEAERAAEAVGDSASVAKAWINRASILMDLGDYARAEELLVDAHALSTRLGDVRSAGRALNNLGKWHVDVGDPVVAIEVLHDARALNQLTGDQVGEINALGQLGLQHARIGSLGSAIAYLDSAQARARELGLRQEEASNLEILSDIWASAGDYRRALALLAQAEEIHRTQDAALEVGANLRRAAEIQSILGNPELGIRLASDALRIHRDVGAPFEELDDLLVLAEMAHADGRVAASMGHVEAATRLAAEIDTRTARVAVALTAARIADRESDSEGVLRVIGAHAEDLYIDDAYQWEAHALAARAYVLQGRTDSAIAAGLRAVEAVERVRRQLGSGSLRTSYITERSSAYGDLAETLLAAGRVDEAFEITDAAHGRALLEHVLSPRTASNGRSATAELAEGERWLLRVNQLLARLDELDEIPERERTPEHEADAARMSAELERARSEYEAALDRARAADPAGLALLGGRGSRFLDIRDALEPGEVLLEYLVRPDHLVLFAVRPGGVRVFTVEIDAAELATRVRVAREMLERSRREPTAGRGVLEGLHALLLAPAEGDGALRGATRVVVVPHGPLTYLPFAALIDARTGSFAAQSYEFTYLASAAALAALRSRPEPRAPLADRGGTVFAPFPADLPATSDEAEAFHRTVPGALVFRGDEASESEFRRAIGEGGIVHAATHGILNARNPMFSRIELSPSPGDGDGRFEVHELLALTVRSPLVFLSGCETGVGAGFATGFSRGQDYATLAQAFLYAGASNVIATLWRVEDESTAVFAERFYSALGRSEPAEALAAAQRTMIADSRFGAPYYWAAFRLSGSGWLSRPAQRSVGVPVKPISNVFPRAGDVK